MRGGLQQLIEGFAEAVVLCDADLRVLAANGEARALLGLQPGDPFPPDALLSADLAPLPPDAQPARRAVSRRAPVYRQHLALRRDERHYRDLLVSALPRLRPDGEVGLLLVTLLDITRELTVVSELRVFERFFELSRDLLIVTDADLQVLHVNDAVVTALGRDHASYLGEGLRSMTHPDDVARAVLIREAGGRSREFTSRVRTERGEWRSITWQMARGNAPQGGATYFARGVDITARLAEQRELARAREVVHDAFELTRLAVLEKNLRDGSVTLTSQLRELLELGQARVTSLEPFVEPLDLVRLRTYAAAPDPAHPIFVRLRTAAGNLRAVNLWLRETSEYQLTVVQDVTQQALMSAQQRLDERLNSLSTMAAGVAHEINNPLAFISANLNFVSEALAQPTAHQPGASTELIDAVREAKEGVERVRDIVAALRPFSRISPEARSACNVPRLVRAALNLTHHALQDRTRVTVELQPVPPVWANEARLSQVVLELLTNAAQAIPPGQAEDNELRVSTRVDGDSALIEVEDTGTGIAPDVLPRVFDPFFSTRHRGEGAGLGLSLTRGVVREYGGELTVESTFGHGARFTVRLPLAGAAPTSPAPPQGLRVLVVDDEAVVARATQRLLARRHRVSLATSGAAALELLQREPFDVVLCDLNMPDLSGMALWERLPESTRKTFVFVTGGAYTEETETFLATHTPRVLLKPFGPRELDALLDAFTPGDAAPRRG